MSASRSPFTAFRGEVLPGIGHNQGPPIEPGRRWRAHCWKTARKELLPKLPLEIVRRRVKRAQELGLAYPQYASILLGSGRDILGFLFTCDAIGLRLEKRLALPEDRAQKLRAITGADRLLMGERDADPTALAEAIAQAHQIRFRGAAALPPEGASWGTGRAAIRALLDPLHLPGDAVVMIGTTPAQRSWADAAGTAKFLPAESYFSTTR